MITSRKRKEETTGGGRGAGTRTRRKISRFVICSLVACMILALFSDPDFSFSNRRTQHSSDELSCTWFPDNHATCDELISRRLHLSTSKDLQHSDTDSDTDSVDENVSLNAKAKHQRWIFFGDSTMKRLFDLSDLKQQLVVQPYAQYQIMRMSSNQPTCLGRPNVTCEEHQQKDQCELNAVYGLPAHADQWQWKNPDPYMYEGPVRYGAEQGKEFCTDCSGCQAHFLECSSEASESSETSAHEEATSTTTSTTTNTNCNVHGPRVYGGYMTMEFARDVELQTPEFGTTQENIAAYLSRVWNTPELTRDWEKPICVFSGGNHDIIVPGMTFDRYLHNVRWMLQTMQSECRHFIWLSNAPNAQKSRFPQHLRIMKAWDDGVKDIMATDQDLVHMSSFIDVLDASLTFSHSDYIHMEDRWYEELGKWFASLIVSVEEESVPKHSSEIIKDAWWFGPRIE